MLETTDLFSIVKKKNIYHRSNFIRYRWIFMKLSYYEIFHFTKIENVFRLFSLQKKDRFNTRSWKRSIDRSITFAATTRWTGTKKNRGKKTERRTKKKKKKKRIELFLHDRSLEKSSLLARCLSLSLWKKKLILFLRVNDQIALDISPYKTRFEHFYQIRKREHWTEK